MTYRKQFCFLSKIILLYLLVFHTTNVKSQTCGGCTITVSITDNTNRTLTSGQKLCVTSSGTVTGIITLAGGSICNEGDFTPSTFSYSSGTFDNHGSATTGSIGLSGGSTVFTNYSGATLIISGTLGITNSGSSFINHGTATIAGAQTKSAGTITNGGTITFSSTMGQSGGTYTNSGTISCTGLAISGGTFNNNTPGNISVSGNFSNSGVATNNTGTISCTGNFTNSGIFNINSGIVSVVNFTNNGTVHGPGSGNGCGSIQATTTTTNSGTINDYADICDATPPGGAIKIDNNTGTVTNVSYCTCCVLTTPSISGTKTICNGSSTTLTASSGGTSYSWSTGATTSAITVSPTSTTTYSITITYTNGCTRSLLDTVTVNSTPTASAGSNQSICNGASISIGGSPTASGGTSPYTYAWTPATGLSSTTTANPTANPSSTTNYTVTVTDNKGCTKNSTVSITVNPTLIINAGSDVTIPSGSNTTIGGSPTISGGTSPYIYSWSPATGLNSTTIANPDAAPTVTTEYIVIVTDNVGCTKADEVVVIVKTITYAVLNKKLDGGFYESSDGKLYFKYEGEYNLGTLDYKVYENDTRTSINITAINSSIKKYGDNRYELNLASVLSATGKSYTLEIKNEKNTNYYLKFKY